MLNRDTHTAPLFIHTRKHRTITVNRPQARCSAAFVENYLFATRPVTSLGHQEGRRVFREGGPNFLNYVQHIFPDGRKIFLGVKPPLFTGLFATDVLQLVLQPGSPLIENPAFSVLSCSIQLLAEKYFTIAQNSYY